MIGPKRIEPADLADPTGVHRRTPVETQDLSPEEQAERETFRHRLRSFEACANRVRALNASEQMRAIQAETRTSIERIWRDNAPARANARGVPSRHDVRSVALRHNPPNGLAMDTVVSFLRWRARARDQAGMRGIPGVLVLLSRAGGGKTSAGGWALTWHRESALYTTAAHVAANPLIHHSEARSAWEALCTPDLLVIDEMGREPSEKGPSMLMALYLERDARGRATILMGNRTIVEFLDRYVMGDEAILSRLEQQRARGLDPVVAFTGSDLRNSTDHAARRAD